MPDKPPHDAIGPAWLEFIDSSMVLLTPLPDDRGADQFLDFRREVLALAKSEEFLSELKEKCQALHVNLTQHKPIAALLVMELKAFPLAMEVAGPELKAPDATAKRRRWGERADTVLKSVGDLLKDLPPWAKMTITLVRELYALLKG